MRSLPLVLLVLSVLSACAGGNPGAAVDASSTDGRASSTDGALDAMPIAVLRGVDRAGAFSMTEATTLATSDGVKWTGVYVGGPCSAGSGWTKALLTAMASELGWTFMPTYVGRQSPSICNAGALTAAQGTTDGSAAAAEMATFGWDPNLQIPLCLDLEAGTYTYSASGSMAYAKAWRDAVRAGGYLAYLYSSPTAIEDLDGAGIAFDGAWPASWLYTSFTDVAPEALGPLGSDYTAQDRAWQYGSFAVSGAGGVDGDTSDLLLAPAPGGTNL